MAGKAKNDGIWIEGSATVVAGAMAAGTGATAVGSTQYSEAPANLEELRAALDSLVAQLRSAPAGSATPRRSQRLRSWHTARRARASRTSAP
jgi:hypothetical protein